MLTATKVKWTPILMRGELVRATLADVKTNTRRTRGLDGFNKWPDKYVFDGMQEGNRSIALFHSVNREFTYRLQCPYGGPGDRLWVRETWGESSLGRLIYRASTEEVDRIAKEEKWVSNPRWRPSIHMPRSACRLTLELTDVNVERLQQITEQGAIAEGVGPGFLPCPHPQFPDMQTTRCVGHRPMFARLWDQINGKGNWGASPWVWVLSFKRLITGC